MRLIADESCDYAIVLGLRASGHDVVSITETASGSDDEHVISLASSLRRLLITEDKDFGQLVFVLSEGEFGCRSHPLSSAHPRGACRHAR